MTIATQINDIGQLVDPVTHEIIGFQNSDGSQTLLSQLKTVLVTCTAAILDASTGTGKVVVIPGMAGQQFKIRDITLVGGGTNFGAGGDRLLSLTDGTTVYTTIANADIESAPAASLRWANAKVPMLTNTDNTLSVAGADVYFQYSGGTPATPHTTGSIQFRVMYERLV